MTWEAVGVMWEVVEEGGRSTGAERCMVMPAVHPREKP